MRIVHILAPAPVGGLETVVRGLASGQHARGHDVCIVAIGASSTAEAFRVGIPTGVTVKDVPLSTRHLMREHRAVRDICRTFQPDVVHTHGYRSDILHLQAARRSGTATVTTLHGFTGGSSRMRAYKALQMYAVRRADAVVAVSRPLATLVSTWHTDPERIHLVRNAHVPPVKDVDPGKVLARVHRDREKFNVAWIGRLGFEKGPDIAINALPHVRDIPLVISVFGDGIELPKLVAQAHRLQVKDAVRFHGMIAGAGAAIAGFDAVLISSRTEGTPMVLFEAMAARIPVIAARVGGIPDVVSDEDAILVEPEDAKQIADAMRELFNHPAEARQRAEHAFRRLGADCGVNEWLDRYEAVYADARRRARSGHSRRQTPTKSSTL